MVNREAMSMLHQDLLYRDILDNLSDGVYFVDKDRRITYWNKGAIRITGFTEKEAIGKCCADNLLMHIDEKGTCLCTEGCPLLDTIASGRHCEAEVYLHHKDGHRVPVVVRVAPVRSQDGDIVGAVEVFSDNSAKLSAIKRIEELEQIALLCPVTQVGNRRYAEMVLNDRLSEKLRYGWPFGVMFVDIDHFKKFNDKYGHDIGDEVLRMVARSLTSGVRSFDFVGRWGGEEFVIILANTDRPTLVAAAERCRMLVENSQFSHGKRLLQVTVSLGATEAREGDGINSLVKRADALMYRSKQEGRNRTTTD